MLNYGLWKGLTVHPRVLLASLVLQAPLSSWLASIFVIHTLSTFKRAC